MPRFHIPGRALNLAIGFTYFGKGVVYIALENPTGVFDIALGVEYLAKARHDYPRDGAGDKIDGKDDDHGKDSDK